MAKISPKPFHEAFIDIVGNRGIRKISIQCLYVFLDFLPMIEIPKDSIKEVCDALDDFEEFVLARHDKDFALKVSYRIKKAKEDLEQRK